MPTSDVIWSGPIGNTGYVMCIEPIGYNMNKGLLVVENSVGDEVYQKEVPISRRTPGGGSPANIREWQNVVTNWMTNVL